MLIMFSKNPSSSFNIPKNEGFSLVELMIGIAVIAILATIAVPEFKSILKDIQVRNAAESVANALQKARAEAVSRNRAVAFTLGADADGTRSDWTISVVSTASVIEARTSKEGSAAVTRTEMPDGATTITFNSLGGVVVNADGSARLESVDFDATDANSQLRVEIGAGGNARMCDPNVSTGTQKCDY